MNRLDILQKVYGAEYILSESERERLMLVIEETVRECINLTSDIELSGLYTEEYEQGLWDGIHMCRKQIKNHFEDQ